MKSKMALSGACAVASLFACAATSWADGAPVAPQPNFAQMLEMGQLSIHTQPTFSSPTISLLTTPSAAKTDVSTFLKTRVTFGVKKASFLSAFNAVLDASPKTCPMECRQIKPIKVSFNGRDENAGLALDALAKMGGASLWVLPDKLLLSPANLLTKDEAQNAKPFSVLVSKATLAPGKSLVLKSSQVDIVALMNKKISASVGKGGIIEALNACEDGVRSTAGIWATNGLEANYRASLGPADAEMGVKVGDLSFSLENVAYGEALGAIAHTVGCELYLIPSGYLICPAGELTSDEQKVAVPAFSYPGLDTPNPSAPKA